MNTVSLTLDVKVNKDVNTFTDAVDRRQGTFTDAVDRRQGRRQETNSTLDLGAKKSTLQMVDMLKNEIEMIVKLNKTQISNEERKKNTNLKQQKMDQLKKLNEDLKIIYKNERSEMTKNNRILAVQKAMDSLDFRAAKKKKNDTEAIDKAKKAKEQRELVRKTYIESKEIEKIYLENDCKLLPGNLFLHESIIKKYGLCPFIKEETHSKDTKSIKRLEWLSSTEDNGEYYYNLYKDLYEYKSINLLKDEKQKLEDQIDNFITSTLVDSQKEIYNDSIAFFKEYVECSIKSKRIKERYKGFVNNMSILFSETSLPIHEYLSIKYNIQIVINDTNSKNELDKMVKMFKILCIEEFDNLVHDYDEIIKSIQNNEKFINNTRNNLNNNLYSYLTNREDFFKKIGFTGNKKEIKISREGKYFKKWTLLSNEERLERFYEYSEYFIKKNTDSQTDKVQHLYDLLKNAFLKKKIVYRNYTWNVTSGIIDNIKILLYNKDKNEFVLNNIKENQENQGTLPINVGDGRGTLPINVGDGRGTTNSNSIDKKKTIKKISTKTIITKQIEKIINEELLYFIIKKLKGTETEADKEEFIDHIKEKISVKKINKNDKEIIYKKYDEIYIIIKNNKK